MAHDKTQESIAELAVDDDALAERLEAAELAITALQGDVERLQKLLEPRHLHGAQSAPLKR